MAVKTNQENGFSAIVVALIVVGVIIVGAIGWQIWWATRSNTAKNTPAATIQKSSQATPAKSKNLMISDWGVELTPDSSLSGLKTKPTTNTDEKMFVTYDMQSLGEACSGTAPGSRPLGAIVKSSIELPQPSNNVFIKKINGTFYYYYGPSQSCSADHDAEVLQYKNVDKIKASLSTLKASS